MIVFLAQRKAKGVPMTKMLRRKERTREENEDPDQKRMPILASLTREDGRREWLVLLGEEPYGSVQHPLPLSALPSNFENHIARRL